MAANTISDNGTDTASQTVFEGNTFTGLDLSKQVDTSTATSVESDVYQTLPSPPVQSIGETTTTTSTATMFQSANDVTGDYKYYEYGSDSGTEQQGNTTSVLASGLSQSDSATFHARASGNNVDGTSTVSEVTVDSSTAVNSVDYASDVDDSTQTITGTSTTTLRETANLVTGISAATQTAGSSETLQESGGRSGSTYQLVQTTSDTATTISASNDVTGVYTQTVTDSNTTSLDEVGSASSGSFTLLQTTTVTIATVEVGNSISTDYVVTESATQSETTNEIGGNAGSGYTLVETSGNTIGEFETGNMIAGTYSLSETAAPTSSLVEVGTNDLGAFSLNETISETQTVTGTGNTMWGNYTLTTVDAQSYSWVQTNSALAGSYVLTATGQESYSATQTGNSLTQNYTTSETGSDTFTLQETAADQQTIAGAEAFTMIETGNDASGDFSRWASGTIAYQTVTEGPVDTDTTSYWMNAAGNFLVGSLSVSESGATQYSLLEAFNNTASGQNGAAPGNVDYEPFGAGFSLGEAPSVPSGGIATVTGPQSAGVDSSTGAAGVTEWQSGRDVAGASQIASYAQYGPELFQEYCISRKLSFQTERGGPVRITKENEELLAGPEDDPHAAIGSRKVEAIFLGHAPVIEVEVNGRVMLITPKHRVFVWGKGWVRATTLKPGDVLRSHDGQRPVVQAVTDKGVKVDVYNVRVADYHTYFVSDPEWGFSIWAHNTYVSKEVAEGPSQFELARAQLPDDIVEANETMRDADVSVLDAIEKPINPFTPGGQAAKRYDTLLEMEEAGVPGATELLAKQIERDGNPAPGYAFQAQRAVDYYESGDLIAIEPEIDFPDGRGIPDLELTDNRLVETKSWEKWDEYTIEQQDGMLDGLQSEVNKYLSDPSKTLQVEFKGFIPAPAEAVLLKLAGDYGTRLDYKPI